jgi:hypothetical protein
VRARAVRHGRRVALEAFDWSALSLSSHRPKPLQQKQDGVADDVFEVLGRGLVPGIGPAQLPGDDLAKKRPQMAVEEPFEVAFGILLVCGVDEAAQQRIDHGENGRHMSFIP